MYTLNFILNRLGAERKILYLSSPGRTLIAFVSESLGEIGSSTQKEEGGFSHKPPNLDIAVVDQPPNALHSLVKFRTK
jgi:hypothetical protein